MRAKGCKASFLLSFFTLLYSTHDVRSASAATSEHTAQGPQTRTHRGAAITTSVSGHASSQTGDLSTLVTRSPPLLLPIPPHPHLLPLSLGLTPLGPHRGGSRRTDLFTSAFSLSTVPAGPILVGTHARVSFQDDLKHSLIDFADGGTGFPLGRVVKNPPAVAETQETMV